MRIYNNRYTNLKKIIINIFTENTSFSWNLPSIEEIKAENDKSIYKPKIKNPNQFPKILSMLDKPEEIEMSVAESSSICLERFTPSLSNVKDYKTIQSYLSLKNISLNINKSDLVCISGKHLSGKSTLIQSILGETQLIDNDTLGKNYLSITNLIIEIFNNVKITIQSISDIYNYMRNFRELIHLNPPVKIYGNVALIQTDLWIRDCWIRDNIILEQDFIKEKYDKISKILNLESIFIKFPELDSSRSLGRPNLDYLI